MLSDNGYCCLQKILNEQYDAIKDYDTFNYLEKCGYISTAGNGAAYITPLGEEACKDYEIAETNRKYLEKNYKVSKSAHKLSIVAFIIPTIISIIALIFSA